MVILVHICRVIFFAVAVAVAVFAVLVIVGRRRIPEKKRRSWCLLDFSYRLLQPRYSVFA